MADPVLDLETIKESALVTIDKIGYQLTAPDGLSILDYRLMSKVMPRLEELLEVDEPSPADGVELQGCFDQLCRIVLPTAPAEVLEKLAPLQRVQVYHAFLRLPHETLQRVGALIRRGSRTPATTATPPTNGKRSTGSRSPRGSRVSTLAETHAGG